MNDMSNLIFKCKFYPHQNNHYNKSFQDILNMFKPIMDYIFCILDPLIVEKSAYDFDDVSQLLMERKLGPYLKTYPNFFSRDIIMYNKVNKNIVFSSWNCRG
jgi:hypothetical protein